jgi:SAM-dependent methyltransferase
MGLVSATLKRVLALSYRGRMLSEVLRFNDTTEVNDLPEIAHYWSNTYLRPLLEEHGCSNPEAFFARYLAEGMQRSGDAEPVFLSVGAGNCDTEIRVAQLMRQAGIARFTIECMDVNAEMLERGRVAAEAEGVGAHLAFTRGDFNRWQPRRKYAAVMANQSLHHVVRLEHLFDAIRESLQPGAYFVVCDMIGRNGHQRWPEALEAVHAFWRELPREYTWNRQLSRFEQPFANWDSSREGFEGIRAQDILPLLLERFHFHLFIGVANCIDVFIDRAFGHHFDASREWDRDFIDRVHAHDEAGFRAGTLTPTRLFAVMATDAAPVRRLARGLTPEASVRRP